MKNADVKAQQDKLKSLGYRIADKPGYFGKNTCNAVADIQSKNIIDATGKLDIQTADLAKLKVNSLSAINHTKNVKGASMTAKDVEKKIKKCFGKLKGESKSGIFSPEVFQEYNDSATHLETDIKKPMTDIFNTLLDKWTIGAFYGENNFDNIINYITASTSLGLPIQKDKVQEIFRIDSEKEKKTVMKSKSDMNVQQYSDLLKAATDEYIQHAEFERLRSSQKPLDQTVNRLASTAKFSRVVSERIENIELCKILSAELKERIHDYDDVVSKVKDTGMIDALNMGNGVIISEFNSDSLPPVEIEYLRKSGVENPESLIKLLEIIARNRPVASPPPEIILKTARDNIESAAAILFDQMPAEKIFKKRKLCAGIGKILGGAVLAGGNIWSVVATFVTVPAALGSVGASIVFIGEGIESCKGE